MASGNAQPPAYGGSGGGMSQVFSSPKAQGVVDQAQSNPMAASLRSPGGVGRMMQDVVGFDPYKEASSVLDQLPSNNNTEFARGTLGLANKMMNPAPQQGEQASPISFRNIQALAGTGYAPRRWA